MALGGGTEYWELISGTGNGHWALGAGAGHWELLAAPGAGAERGRWSRYRALDTGAATGPPAALAGPGERPRSPRFGPPAPPSSPSAAPAGSCSPVCRGGAAARTTTPSMQRGRACALRTGSGVDGRAGGRRRRFRRPRGQRSRPWDRTSSCRCSFRGTQRGTLGGKFPLKKGKLCPGGGTAPLPGSDPSSVPVEPGEELQRAQEQWEALEQTQAELGGPLAAAPPPISFQEALQFFQSADLSQCRRQARGPGGAHGLAALLRCLTGPPRLRRRLREERELALAMANCALDDTEWVHMRILQTIYTQLTRSRLSCPRYGPHWEELGFQGMVTPPLPWVPMPDSPLGEEITPYFQPQPHLRSFPLLALVPLRPLISERSLCLMSRLRGLLTKRSVEKNSGIND
ncbi:ELMO domain-containing protein 3 isoform X4 [Patagioenas fasciata]|uniref:ELMO domain-containing protein 3 isoform X4 n=1 Tax=Patagioenas fasciata TaxID=372321 RepID=UPI003A9A11C7